MNSWSLISPHLSRAQTLSRPDRLPQDPLATFSGLSGVRYKGLNTPFSIHVCFVSERSHGSERRKSTLLDLIRGVSAEILYMHFYRESTCQRKCLPQVEFPIFQEKWPGPDRRHVVSNFVQWRPESARLAAAGHAPKPGVPGALYMFLLPS